jgi:hypothetical protein
MKFASAIRVLDGGQEAEKNGETPHRPQRPSVDSVAIRTPSIWGNSRRRVMLPNGGDDLKIAPLA